MKIVRAFFLLILLVSVALFSGFAPIYSQSQDPRVLEQQIETYKNEIKRLQSQSNTLANQVAQFDLQINLAQTKIDQTQEKIILLGGRIDQLETSLSSLTAAFASRVLETYKMARLGQPVYILFSSQIKEIVSKFHYLKKIQESDRNLMVRLQTTQNTYKSQKGDLESLQKQLGVQKEALNGQKKAKANLLSVTKNDEKKYQSLLASAKAEYEAIQAIISGRGSETDIGHIGEGNKIASIIDGPSCNSGGTHTHFVVSINGQTQNPFNYLKNGINYSNCSGSSCDSSDGDPFNPSGSWEWPIAQKILFNQGYGVTWAVKNTWVGKIYSSHNGIDITSEASSEIRSVKSGELFRGSYSLNSCALRYVRVHHDEGGMDTFYLHVNY